MNKSKNRDLPPDSLLTPEQEAVLDLYIENLDYIFEEIKEAEKTQVEIETLHLKRILSK
jgi:predicted DNA-binding protein YlxM (UPF0122 family)